MLSYFSTFLVVLSLAIAAYFYQFMPPQVLVPWGRSGGYANKFWGLFALPFLALAFFVMTFAISRYFFYKKNIYSETKNYNFSAIGVKKFINYYDGLVLAVVLFLGYFLALVLFKNSGVAININRFLVIGTGLLIFYLGVIVSQAKSSWFRHESEKKVISEKDWNKWILFSGVLFMISGGVSILGSWVPQYSWYFVGVPVVVSIILIFVYTKFFLKKRSTRRKANFTTISG